MTLESTSTILVLGHFANIKLAGDRVVRDAVQTIRRDNPHPNDRTTGHHNLRPLSSAHSRHLPPSLNPATHPGITNRPLPRRRRRIPTTTTLNSNPRSFPRSLLGAPAGNTHPSSSSSSSAAASAQHPHGGLVSRSTRVGVMSDADLEAELAARRAARARERERYARAMRSEKLSLLEGELMRLRSEISRLDRPSALSGGGGTPPTARWEALPNPPRGMPPSMATTAHQQPGHPPAHPAGLPQGPPPPPPPPPPAGMGEGEEPMDPERQRREKEERVKRREAKRRERENAKKPLTLAEIIRGAGPDPMKRLKPSGSTQLKDVHEPEPEVATENFTDVKEGLKKTGGLEGKKEEGGGEGKKVVDGEEEKKGEEEKEKEKEGDSGVDSKDDKDGKGGRDDTKGTEEGKEIEGKTDGKEESKVEENKVKVDEEKGEEKKDEAKGTMEAGSTDGKKNGKEVIANGDASKEVKEAETEKKGDKKEGIKARSGTEEKGGKDKGSVDAVSALGALASKLPVVKGKVGTKGGAEGAGSGGGRKRMTLEEKRRLRRELSNGAEGQNGKGKDGAEGKGELEDLKVD